MSSHLGKLRAISKSREMAIRALSASTARVVCASSAVPVWPRSRPPVASADEARNLRREGRLVVITRICEGKQECRKGTNSFYQPNPRDLGNQLVERGEGDG